MFLISILLALAIVGYLHAKNATTAMESDTAENKMQEVQQTVDAAMQQQMDSLKKQSEQQ
jgi:sensor domain CHASE-containing protein